MKKSVYIETSVVSYYTSKASNDIIIAARQKVTHYWWKNRIHDFEVFISELVLRESKEGDPKAAKKRMASLKDFKYLELNDDTYSLAKYLLKSYAIPKKFPEDALHISIAAIHGIDFLLTWNFKHINNAERKTAIEHAINEYGNLCPIICTPEELLGE